jgi:dienelactone hydrolase
LNKKNQMVQAFVGVACLVVGAAMALYPAKRYSERRFLVDAAACKMDLQVLTRADLAATPETGAVVLLHGISANRLIMQYLARSFAELGLRVYVPDLPGHGRSPGPFSPEEAEGCSLSLVRGLAARGMIVPERTILAGHSMGGAIAIRIAERFRPAGVIAISPAPMQPAHGVISENLLFHSLPRLVPNTRILVGQFEPKSFVDNAADLAANSADPSAQFTVVPHTTHVGMLFSPTVARAAQDWASHVLALPGNAPLPSRANLSGCLIGLVGLLLLSGPFVREMTGKEPRADLGAPGIPRTRGAIEITLLSVIVMFLLHFWLPFRVLHLFEGDYLASFFVLTGLALILLHQKSARAQLHTPPTLLLAAAFAAILLHLLITGWFELTASETWLTIPRWERFLPFFVAAFLFLFAVDLLAGPAENGRTRYGYWLLLMILPWLALAGGVLYFKTGEILLVLLSPYFALQFVLSGLGTQLVRRQTGSAAAAAIFGAILLAGFCLVLFPLS